MRNRRPEYPELVGGYEICRAALAGARTPEELDAHLEEQGLSGMAEDLTGLIRRNPIPAMLIGIGLGYLLARMTRS